MQEVTSSCFSPFALENRRAWRVADRLREAEAERLLGGWIGHADQLPPPTSWHGARLRERVVARVILVARTQVGRQSPTAA